MSDITEEMEVDPRNRCREALFDERSEEFAGRRLLRGLSTIIPGGIANRNAVCL